MKLNVLYEDNHILCLEKPVNMPVMRDASQDKDLLSLAKTYIKEKYRKPGEVYLGLVHRLDRPVGGVMVLARTSKAAARLTKAFAAHQVKKEYLAVLDGIPALPAGTLRDYLVKDQKTNTVRTTDSSHGKEAVLDYEVLSEKDDQALVHITLHTGRSHQIRVQFACRRTPLVYDQRYNPLPGKGQIALFACRISFPHPTLHKEITVSLPLPDVDPFNRFDVKLSTTHHLKVMGL